jgi:hypothetical protein
MAAAGATSPKRMRVYSSASTADTDYSNGAGSSKRVGTHNGSFHCDEALGCFLMRLTSQFAGAEIVRTRDSQVCRFIIGSIGLPFPPKNVSAIFVVVISAMLQDCTSNIRKLYGRIRLRLGLDIVNLTHYQTDFVISGQLFHTAI